MNSKCVLIGNKFATIAQISVFILSISTLFFHKIFIENNMCNFHSAVKKIICCELFKKSKKTENYELHARNWKIWFMDNIKQGLSILYGHFWAIYAAKLLSKDNSDECGWFIIQFLVDTILAIFLTFMLSKLSIKLISLLSKSFADIWLSIGNYDTKYYNYKYKIWIFQTFQWLLCSLLARIICTYLILGNYNYFIIINNWFSNFWTDNRNDELIVVILVIPIIMNIIQLLIQNWFLRWKKETNSDVPENTKRLINVV